MNEDKHRTDIQNGILFTCFFHQKVLGTPRTNFNIIIRGTFMSFAMQNPPKRSIFDCVFNSEAV